MGQSFMMSIETLSVYTYYGNNVVRWYCHRTQVVEEQIAQVTRVRATHRLFYGAGIWSPYFGE